MSLQFIAISFVLIMSLVGTNVTYAYEPTVSIGVLAHRGEDVARKMWQPTADYLSREVNGFDFNIIPLTNDDIAIKVAREEIDFVLTNPASYATLEEKYGISRMTTVRNKRPGGAYTEFGAIIFTRADRHDINKLRDLRGKSFMAVHQDAFGGWWMAWREIKAAGIKGTEEFKRLEFAGFPQDKIVEAVITGRVDAGTVRTDLLERLYKESKISRGELKVINAQTTKGFPFAHSTRLYPEWPFAAQAFVTDELAQRVAIALLKMSGESDAAVAANISGWTVPLDYQPVHALMKELRVGPYTDYGKITLRQLLVQYGHWVAFSIMLLAIMIVVILYISRINRRIAHANDELGKEIDHRKLAENESLHLGRLLDESSNEIIVFDAKTLEFIQVNKGAQRNLGYTLEEFKNMSPLDVCPEFSSTAFEGMVRSLKNGLKKKIIFETRHKRKDGSTYPVEVRLHLSSSFGKKIFIAILEDITERKTVENALHQEKERAQVTLESIGDAVFTTDEKGNIEYLNPVAEKITGWKTSEVLGKPLTHIVKLVFVDTGLPVENPIQRLHREGRFSSLDENILLTGKDNLQTLVHLTVTPRCNRKGTVEGVVLVFRDVSELNQLHRRMKYFATHDDLTGLINRRHFTTILEQTLLNADSGTEKHSLLYLDLDQFKFVNDSCGHAAGDELLRAVTREFKAIIRNADSLARLGGDEFAILLPGCDLQEASRIADQICKRIRQIKFRWQSKVFRLGISIGVVPIDYSSGTLADVLNLADHACYAAKDSGRNNYHVYNANDPMISRRRGEMKWMHRINRALEENQFCLYSQKIMPLKPGLDGKKQFVEVLLRMEHDKHSLIGPGLLFLQQSDNR